MCSKIDIILKEREAKSQRVLWEYYQNEPILSIHTQTMLSHFLTNEAEYIKTIKELSGMVDDLNASLRVMKHSFDVEHSKNTGDFKYN